MNAPVVAGKKPRLVRLAKKGDVLLWCACGRSANQPYCDGSHKGTGFVPLRVTTKSDGEEALFCLCKQTRSPPYCDGSHNALGARYSADAGVDAIDWSNAETVARGGGELGYAYLDGGCFVLTPEPHSETETGGWRMLATIGKRDGADMLSQWLLKPCESPLPISFGAAEVVLFVVEGDATIEISGKRFETPLHSALAVRPGETLSVHSGVNTSTLVATVCPPEPPQFDGSRTPFDQNFPDRTGRENVSAREAMGERFYQVLTSAERGSSKITQFIGMIPKSRSAPHRHLYEETLYILSGEGFMWTESRRAPVKQGDIIYLPRKQLHSLECTTPAGMRLAGSFYPAGSPAINY
jgi:CDGSH-type Zn-finger protein/mannose-6-phosphate isomerase-like protein (cupin superfamily)